MRSLRKLSKKYYCVSHRGSIPNWAKLFVNSNKNKKLNKKINFVFVFVFVFFRFCTLNTFFACLFAGRVWVRWRVIQWNSLNLLYSIWFGFYLFRNKNKHFNDLICLPFFSGLASFAMEWKILCKKSRRTAIRILHGKSLSFIGCIEYVIFGHTKDNVD